MKILSENGGGAGGVKMGKMKFSVFLRFRGVFVRFFQKSEGVGDEVMCEKSRFFTKNRKKSKVRPVRGKGNHQGSKARREE